MNVERLAAIANRPFVDGIAGTGLVIVDDYFPNLLTGFRVAEFNHYLRMFPGLKIAYTTPGFRIHYEAYAARYPEFADRVVPWDSTSLNGAKAVYFVFLNNAHHWVAEVERRGLPFGFTLYPGGGFHLQDEATRVALSRVLNSPMIRGVIATQPITLDILRQHHCRAPVSYIPGVAVSPAYLDLHRISPVETSGDELRICFAAFKYEARGVSKGYPEFLQAAAAIAAWYPQTVFSVAGNFDANDEPIPPSLSGRLTFVGPLATVELREFLLGQDIMVAPSRRFGVTGREFDGFPTGTCIEAALCGVALICSDELDQNRHYDPGNDLIICPPDVSALIRSMDELVRDPARLLTLRENGRQRTKELYAPEAQLIPRTRFLRRLALDVGIPI